MLAYICNKQSVLAISSIHELGCKYISMALHFYFYSYSSSFADACPPERHGLMPQVTLVELGQQAACDPTTNFYSQELLVSFTNLDSITVNHLLINSQNFTLSGTEASPMKFTLVNLLANGQEVNVSASFEGSSSVWFSQSQFNAPSSCALSPTSSGETGQPTPVAPSVPSPTVNAPSSGSRASSTHAVHAFV